MGSLKDLLSKPDALRITMPALSRETMAGLLAVIRRDVAEDKIQIDTPTQNLESYFLQVVQNARRAAAETSGAMSGARVAAYLRGDAETGPVADKILERLIQPQAPAVVAAPPERAAAALVNEKKLEALAKVSGPASAPAPNAEPATQKDLDRANEKLAALVNKPKS